VNHFVIEAILNGVSTSTGPSAASSTRSPTSSPAVTAGMPLRARASRTISASRSCGIALAMPVFATLPATQARLAPRSSGFEKRSAVGGA
jgi:hypothetical protein